MPINRRQQNKDVLETAIRAWYRGHAYGPSYRDLADVTKMSLGTVYSVCRDLRDAGVIEFKDGLARSIQLKG